MAYTTEMRNDYILADAFHALGVRLYGSQWSGYEVQGRKYDDPRPVPRQRPWDKMK